MPSKWGPERAEAQRRRRASAAVVKRGLVLQPGHRYFVEDLDTGECFRLMLVPTGRFLSPDALAAFQEVTG